MSLVLCRIQSPILEESFDDGSTGSTGQPVPFVQTPLYNGVW